MISLSLEDKLISTIPFSFQKGNKAGGCEDAPPIAAPLYSVVCDGLGGAGATKHKIFEGEHKEAVTRTSGYIGSRIVCNCVSSYYSKHYDDLSNEIKAVNTVAGDRAAIIGSFLSDLKSQIIAALDENMNKLGITPSRSKTMKDFPTTLASALYFPNIDGVTMLAIWAGDSRVYILSPQKGLQLLSLDDAKNAENEMNSVSEMTNCISAGNAFQLNYALYDLKGPAITFCCSDGCFDYLPSPLHFEWLLLKTILEFMPESSGEALGKAFVGSVMDNIYKKIGDDTTMTGIIIGIETGNEMKSLYRGRMAESSKLAINMNNQLKELNRIRAEKDAAMKTCKLNEDKVISSIRDEICKAIKPGTTNPTLRTHLAAMPFYNEYAQRIQGIIKRNEEEYISEIKGKEEELQNIKGNCRKMLISDYLKWKRKIDGQGNALFELQRFLLPRRTKGMEQNTQAYMNPVTGMQYVMACIEMYKHPYFKEVASLSSLPVDDTKEHIQSQVRSLKEIKEVLNNADTVFLDLWSQAYFSTENFAEERYEFDLNAKYKDIIEQALNDPQSCKFISGLSSCKIAEYRNKANAVGLIRERVAEEKEKRIENVLEEFWLKHKDEIVEWIMSEKGAKLQSYFENSSVNINILISYVLAKKSLTLIDQKTEMARIKVEEIWKIYRTDYQLFKLITEKGGC